MKSMSRGMTVWGVLVVMALVAFTALLLMRAVPVYLNDMKVQNALEKVATDSEMSDAGGRAGAARPHGAALYCRWHGLERD